MKIIKDGNQYNRKFVCEHCDCEFIASIGEYRKYLTRDALAVKCPSCGIHCDILIKDAPLYNE